MILNQVTTECTLCSKNDMKLVSICTKTFYEDKSKFCFVYRPLMNTLDQWFRTKGPGPTRGHQHASKGAAKWLKISSFKLKKLKIKIQSNIFLI